MMLLLLRLSWSLQYVQFVNILVWNKMKCI